MAATQSTQYAAMLAAEGNYQNASSTEGTQVSGSVHFARVDVVTEADNAASDVITLLELPPGAIVLPELCKIIVTDDMTSGACTIDIGDAADPDRYADGANCAAVGVVDFLTSAIPAGFTTRYPIPAGDNQLITATFATLAATIEAGAFSVIIGYKTL